MKKITAFLLLLIFSFNWFTYRLIFDYAQHQNKVNLETVFDNDLYDESQLMEVKIAMNLPYQTNRPAYERVDGEIEVDGVWYKYVKRKVSEDTLYLMCVINTQKMHLETVRNELYKKMNLPDRTTPAGNGDNGWSVFKNLQNIIHESAFVIPISSLIIDQDKHWLSGIKGSLFANQHLSPEQPPDC